MSPETPLAEEPLIDEEFVPEDDAVIGRAFRRSLWVLFAIGLAVGGFVLLRQKEAAPEVVREKSAGAIPDLVSDAAVMPAVTFSDVTAAWGLDFVHAIGGRGGQATCRRRWAAAPPSSTATGTATRTCSW